MTSSPPPRDQLPPAVRDALEALDEDDAPDPTLDAVHERMRPRFLAMLAEHLPAVDEATKTG